MEGLLNLMKQSYRLQCSCMRKQLQYNSRLVDPLVRENGRLVPASWDKALDRATSGFRASVDRYGPEAFGLFSCSKTTNELNYVSQKFARVGYGSNNIDSCNRT